MSGKVVRLCDCVRQVMPTDKPFTIRDIMEGLEILNPSCVWNKLAVSNVITAMKHRGIIYRVRKPKMGTNAIYAAKGVKAPMPKLGDASLVDVMQAVAVKTMTPVEIMVAVLEAGYETSMARKTLDTTIRKVLRRGRFERQGGKWVVR